MLLIFSSPVSASPTETTVSASTGEADLFYGVKVILTCSFPVYLGTTSSNIKPGGSSTWYIQLNTGTVSLEVFIPLPINEWYSASQEFTGITYPLHITVAPGLSVTLEVSPSASLTIDGPGNIDTASVSFENLGSSETFFVSSYSNAPNGAQITVNADFALDINVGLSIDLFLFKHEIASTPIGGFPMNPKVSESMTVSISFFDQILGFVFSPWGMVISLLTLFGLLATVAMVVSSKRKKKRLQELRPKPRIRQPPPTPPPKQIVLAICPKCKSRIPSESKFCPECGTNLIPKKKRPRKK